MYATSNPNQQREEVETARRTIKVKSAALNAMTKEAPLWMKQAAIDAIRAAEATIAAYAPETKPLHMRNAKGEITATVTGYRHIDDDGTVRYYISPD
ncbi:MAG TPA: hypothetical protein VFH61_04210 [Thermoleophilia bacterium]|nr:hypothetical protein [Thermoleophilia bacterium]